MTGARPELHELRTTDGARAMTTNPLAGKPAEQGMLVDVPRLVTAYFSGVPDPSVPAQRVAFGTSGHRGTAFKRIVQ